MRISDLIEDFIKDMLKTEDELEKITRPFFNKIPYSFILTFHLLKNL